MATNVNNTEQPRAALSVAGNQALFRRTQNEEFYSLLPRTYYNFYYNWVRKDLAWYDGFVDWIHGSSNGLMSTGIGTSIVNRCADTIFGGSLMFKNARKPQDLENGVGKALDFISNKWMSETDGEQVIKKTVRDALAGGFSVLKLNNAGGKLWLDGLRADRFYLDISHGHINKFVCALSFFNDTTDSDKSENRFVLIEERRYENFGAFDDDSKPVVEYKIYRTGTPIQFYTGIKRENYVAWEELPKDVRRAFKESYGDVRLNAPKLLNGFTDLGVYLLKASDGISAIPDIDLGESILNNIETYLYEYDCWNSALNTEIYVSRGRILSPKVFQSPLQTGSYPGGLDDFMFTRCDSDPNNLMAPQPIQFELRSEQFRSVRDTLLQCIAAGIGISVSTLASYLNDGGTQKTAHQVDSETDATTKWVEAMRRRLEKPINAMIAQVCRFNGYSDDVEIRWTRAGFTNQAELVQTLSQAIQAGMISRKKAHDLFNIDEDEEQNAIDYQQVLNEEQARNATAKENLFDFGDTEEING